MRNGAVSASVSSSVPGSATARSAARSSAASPPAFIGAGRGSSGRDRRAPAIRFDQQHLHVAQLAFRKSAFAAAQIEFPQADERLGIAELAHGGQVLEEIPATKRQRARVVRTNVLEMKQLQIRQPPQ